MPRRHLLIIATSKFADGWADIGKGILGEIATARRLFSGSLNYDTITLLQDHTSAELPHRIVEWASQQDVAPDDIVVGYFTGHGVAYAGQLRFITPEIPESRKHMAVSLSDLVVNIWKSRDAPLGNVLLIVDTCQSGAGERSALETAEGLRDAEAGGARATGLSVIATARSIESARPGGFIAEMERAILSGSVAVPEEEWLRLDTLVDRVNEALAQSGSEFGQHASVSGRTERELAFLPNPLWAPRLRSGMGQALAQRALERMHGRDMRVHWSPRARGVSAESEPGWYYTGRGWAMREVLRWLAAGGAAGSGLVVSGPPGVGKSALLARLVTLAHSDHRSRAQAAGALRDIPPEEIPDEGVVSVAIHARAKKSSELALELAVGLGSNLVGASDDLLGTVHSAIANASIAMAAAGGELPKRCIVIVIDAVDEAEDPQRCAQMLGDIVHAPYPIRMLVGLRQLEGATTEVETALGERFTSLRLGQADQGDSDDLARFVSTYLLSRPGSPYGVPQHQEKARAVAEKVAERARSSFLVASRVAHALASQDIVATEADLQRLPSTVSEAFELDLHRFDELRRRRAQFVFGAIAFGKGRGLPRSLWRVIASALAAVEISEEQLSEWLEGTGQYVVHDNEFGEPVLRLYHEAFAEFLRSKVEKACRCRGEESSVLVATSLAPDLPIPAYLQLSWSTESSYVLAYLPAHLSDAAEATDDYTVKGSRVQLKDLPACADWVAAKQARFADPFLLLDDLNTGIHAAMGHIPADVPLLVRLCAAGGRLVGRAPPLVIDTLARVGDLRWASFLAEHATFPLDRCRAMTWLAQRLAERGHLGDAFTCLADVEGTMAGISGSYRAMARSWWIDAAMSINQVGAAQAIAETAFMEAQAAIADAGLRAGKVRELEHLMFWTAKCAAVAGRNDLLSFVQRWETTSTFAWNLDLQIAAAARNVALLNREWEKHCEPGFVASSVVGNLALALASAGHKAKAMDVLRNGSTNDFADNRKRAAWAWALCGHWAQAFEVGLGIEHAEEGMRALHRIQEEAVRQGNASVVAVAADHALRKLEEYDGAVASSGQTRRSSSRKRTQPARKKSSIGGIDEAVDRWRVLSWASHIAAVAQRFDTARALAEAVCSVNVPSTAENCLSYPTPYSAMRRYHVEPQAAADPEAFTALLRSAKRVEDLAKVRGVCEVLYRRTLIPEWSALGECISAMTAEDNRAPWMDGLRYASKLGPGEVGAVANLFPLVSWKDWSAMGLAELTQAIEDGDHIAARIGNWSARL